VWLIIAKPEDIGMKEQVKLVDATPSKRLYLSIIADYDINKAICELIDNALDIWAKNDRLSNLNIDIVLDKQQQRIEVCDDAGGLGESELSFIVGPGHTGNVEADEIIGIFGVGTKRAVVALAQDVSIKTRYRSDTFLIEFDDDWIKANEEWELPVYRVENIPVGTTRIELVKLRKNITEVTESHLQQHLGATYAKFLEDSRVKISVNGKHITPVTFENWAFPPGFEPRIYSGIVQTQDGRVVNVRAEAGLTMESSPAGGEYGVYVYCNDRLIARALKTYDVGFTTGIAGKPHADISLARVLIFLNGAAGLMPWNSSKSDINPSHEIFAALRTWLLQVVKDYTSLARRLSKQEGGWPEHVFKYTTGNSKEIHVADFPKVNTSYLPPLPKIKPQFATVVRKANKAISKEKPWTTGLYESMIAVDWILKRSFEQKNRIALILLDSTLEIAFKEYLVHESGVRYSDSKLQGMFSDRLQVHSEVSRFIKIPEADWKKIGHYYDMRNQLVHRRASITINDSQITDFRSIVENALAELFELEFE
jgi:hypothetical protein